MRSRGGVLASAIAIGALQVVGTYGAGRNQPDRRAVDAVAVALVLLGPLALAVRDRWPLLAVAVAIGAADVYVGRGYPYGPVFVSVVVAVVEAVRAGRRREIWLLAGAGYAGFVVAAFADPRSAGGHDPAGIPSLLATVGLDSRGNDRYRGYSLGMKQRLGIAAALLGDPALLVLDEPANGLDPQGVREMRSLVGRLADGGRTVLVSSHDLSELEQVCDWLVLIDTGRSLYQGPTRDLLDGVVGGLAVAARGAAENDRLRDVLAARGHRVDVHPERLVVNVDGHDVGDLAAAVNQAAFDAGIVVVELSPLRTTLEDRYLSMVHGGAR